MLKSAGESKILFYSNEKRLFSAENIDKITHRRPHGEWNLYEINKWTIKWLGNNLNGILIDMPI